MLSGLVSAFAGNRKGGHTNGAAADSSFDYMTNAVPDPHNPNRVIALDATSVRVIESGKVRLLAGGDKFGYADGSGANAKFECPTGVVFTENSESIIVSDKENNRLRLVNLKSGAVETIAGDGTAESKDGNGTAAQIKEPRYVPLTLDSTHLMRRAM